jgi:tetratricopeptide (TPR) repeat protein
MPGIASFVYCTLGRAYQSLGDYAKAIEYHEQHLAIAKEVGDRAGEGRAYSYLGNAYWLQGDFSKAIKYHGQHLAIAKEVGDRAGKGRAYANLGCAYGSQENYAKAIEYHAQHLAIAKEVDDRAGEGGAYANLGNAYRSQGDYAKAIEYHTQYLAIAKEVGDRAGVGRAYGNLGNAYWSQGDFSKAIEYLAQCLAIAKEVGARAEEGAAYANLGCTYRSQGDFSKAIEYHTQCLAIAKEVGDRAGVGKAYKNLGTCHMHLNEHVKAFAYFEAQHEMATSLKLAHMWSDAALNMGVALTLLVRAARRGPATGADRTPGPHSHSSALACLDDRVREAAKWLQAALDGGHAFAQLHLAHLTFYADQEDAALAHLKEHLSWRVQRGRDTCGGCGQTRGEDTPMLTCSGCRVARFCSADHQRMASKKAALGGSLTTGRHKDICGVLRKWREAVKDGVAPDSCTAELVAFLQRENARHDAPRTQRERQRHFSDDGAPGRRPVTDGQSGDEGEGGEWEDV